MKKNRTIIKPTTAILLIIAMVISLVGCKSNSNNQGDPVEIETENGGGVQSPGGIFDLMKTFTTEVYGADSLENTDADLKNGGAEIINDLAVMFIQKNGIGEEENLLVSPLSIIYALSMTANGAKGDTYNEMIEALGAENIEQLNNYLRAYLCATAMKADTDPGTKVNIANSIWFKEDDTLTIYKDFLETNAKYYNAAAYELPFDDKAKKYINDWISENTNGLIKDMLKQMPMHAVMFLVNALSFEGEWLEPYYEENVWERTFHGEKGDSEVEMMHGAFYDYLEDDKAKGFVQYYNDHDYYFAAILPNEDVTLDEYLEGLTGEHLYELLSNHKNEEVHTALPKFETRSELSLAETLVGMGMKTAFDDEKADFSKLGVSEGKNIFIGDVLHNTFIKVDELGTKAGAATIVAMLDAAAIAPEEPKVVILDRPFIYMLVDAAENVPIFIGTMRNIEG